MSIEVVNKAIGYKIDCPFCKSVLKFGREDMKDVFPYGYSILCPVCKNAIRVADNSGEFNIMVEPTFDKGMNVIDKYDAYRNILLGDKEE